MNYAIVNVPADGPIGVRLLAAEGTRVVLPDGSYRAVEAWEHRLCRAASLPACPVVDGRARGDYLRLIRADGVELRADGAPLPATYGGQK